MSIKNRALIALSVDIVTILLIVAKLTGVLDTPWTIVFAPWALLILGTMIILSCRELLSV